MTYTSVFSVMVMRLIKIAIFVIYCIVSIHCATNIVTWNVISRAVILLPLCSWIIVAFHELSHVVCFRVFGFNIKAFRIGLLLIRFGKGTNKITLMDSGMFRGFCSIENNLQKSKTRLLIPLISGGMSGLLASIASLVSLILNITPEEWNCFFISLFCVGLYSFYATLLSPHSADGKLIRRIIKEEYGK